MGKESAIEISSKTEREGKRKERKGGRERRSKMRGFVFYFREMRFSLEYFEWIERLAREVKSHLRLRQRFEVEVDHLQEKGEEDAMVVIQLRRKSVFFLIILN